MTSDELLTRDLNLLVVLRTLLDTRSVTEAGRRLGLSPSATSHALGRLRETFGDALLVRSGNAMEATPRAEALRPSLERVLDNARLLFREEPEFEPAISERAFQLAASDLIAPLLPGWIAEIGQAAPGIRLTLVREVSTPHAGEFAAAGIDVAVQADRAPTVGLVAKRLGRVRFVAVARRGHAYLAKPTLATWRAAPHVAVGTDRPGPGFVGDALLRAGVERRVALKVPSFLLALHALADTDLLLAAPSALVTSIAARLGLETAPLPFRVPPVPVAATWPERWKDDPGHRWFREGLCERLSTQLRTR